MTSRKILVGALVAMLVSPAWGGGSPVGSVTSSIGASIRDTKLTQGSTVFSGDEISVPARGGAIIALSGGAQAEVLGDSSIQLTKVSNRIQMVVNKGQASFHTPDGGEISALVGGVTASPAKKSETTAIIQSLSATHAVVAAKKGSLLITMTNDGRVYTIPEGKAADLTAADDPPQQAGTVPTRKSAHALPLNNKKVLLLTAVMVNGAAAVTAYALLRHETKLTTTQIGNEISPHTLN